MKKNADNACPLVKRQARYEWELDATIRSVIRNAPDLTALQAALQERVMNDTRYLKLPKYRQMRCEAYAEGALDMLMELAGNTISVPLIAQAKPRVRTAPKVKPKKQVDVTVPPMTYPTGVGAKTYQMPGWITSPGYTQPFPFAEASHG